MKLIIKKHLIISMCLLSVSLLILFILKPNIHRKPSISFWIWHSNASINSEQQKTLKKLKVKTLYLKAGEFEIKNDKAIFFNHQLNIRKRDFIKYKITLVYTFGSQFRKEFTILNNLRIQEFIKNTIIKNINQFVKDNILVQGIQIDFDGPESKVKEYLGLIKYLKHNIQEDYELSCTVLFSWIKNQNFIKLIHSVDYYVPMLYFYESHDNINTFKPLIEYNKFKLMLNTFKLFQKKYYLGLPTFGNCYIYNPDQQIKYLDNQIKIDYLLENNFQYILNIKTYPYNKNINYENIYHFNLLSPLYLKNYIIPAGWHIIFDTITIQGLKKYYSNVTKHSDKNLKGVILFRFPKQQDNLVLSLKSIEKSIIKPELNWQKNINIEIKILEDTKEYIIFKIILKNQSETSSILDKENQFIQFRIQEASIESIDMGEFDRLSYGVGKNDAIQLSSIKRASVIRLYEYYLNNNETVETGRIKLIKKDDQYKGNYYIYSHFYFNINNKKKKIIEEWRSFYE